jgi:hypothetical protein
LRKFREREFLNYAHSGGGEIVEDILTDIFSCSLAVASQRYSLNIFSSLPLLSGEPVSPESVITDNREEFGKN